VRLYLAPKFGRPVDRVCFAKAVAAYRPSDRTVPHETTVKGWEEGARPNDATVEAIADLARVVGLPWATREWITYRTGEDPPILPSISSEPSGASQPVSSADLKKRKGKSA